MKIVLTGSLGNLGKPLTEQLVKKGHSVVVISSKTERIKEIEALGAKALVGSIFDADFLSEAFNGAEIVYLMETMEAAGDMFDTNVDFYERISEIGKCYKTAVERAGVTKVIHLSSIGAHMATGNGILKFHHDVETTLRQLPAEISIKFIRPVGFYINMFSFVHHIKSKGEIISNYGGDKKEPWVSPVDIAAAISEEMDKPFDGRTIRYVASDEISPNEIAKALGEAIGKPDLKWNVISNEQLLKTWLGIGFNSQVAHGFVELQASQGTGEIYEDYYRNKPTLGNVKLKDFAKEFAEYYKNE